MVKLNISRPLCFFDLETTGINIGKDKIVEICLIKVNPDATEDILEQRINPEMPIPKYATEIHGIKDEDVKDKPTFREFAPSLMQFIGNSDFAGFNALRFDIPLLAEEFLRAEIDFDLRDRRVIDVQNIFHKMEPRNLKAAYRFYCDKNLENAHSALADTKATLEILRSQLVKYEGVEIENADGAPHCPVKNDIHALASFSQQQACADLAGHVVYNEMGQEVINFGKHKGKTVEEVFRIEPQYYEWMMRSDFPLYTKKIISSIRLRYFGK